MIREDDTHVIHGPSPIQPIAKISMGQLCYDNLLCNVGKVALIDAITRASLSYKDLLVLTCSLAKSLELNGYGKDTIVSICSENNIHFYIPLISAMYIGAIVAPVNHNYTKQESIHVLNIFKSKVIFCSRPVSDKYVSLRRNDLNFVEKIVVIDSDEDIFGAISMKQFISQSIGDVLWQWFPITKIEPRKQVALIMCSSGTTGLPKGVMQTHENVMIRYLHTLDPRYVYPAESFLGVLPFFHGFGLLTNWFAFLTGQTVIVMQRFEEEIFFKTIQDYKIPALNIAPPLVILMSKSTLVNKYDLSCIKDVASAAAPLGKVTEERLKKKLNISSVRQGYGLTEATLGVLLNTIGVEKHGSSGKVVTYASCKVRDPETGKSLGPNEVGELCFKGPMVMPGYYNNEEATKNSFTSDGWLLTGDAGYYDSDKYFYIVGRLKELIKYKGYQVAPAELEACLLSNPNIQDSGVVGVPDEEAGELPLAFVVKSKNVDLLEKDIQNFVAERVSSQKQLRGGVIFVDTIPKNPSGKILRKDLKNMVNSFRAKL